MKEIDPHPPILNLAHPPEFSMWQPPPLHHSANDLHSSLFLFCFKSCHFEPVRPDKIKGDRIHRAGQWCRGWSKVRPWRMLQLLVSALLGFFDVKVSPLSSSLYNWFIIVTRADVDIHRHENISIWQRLRKSLIKFSKLGISSIKARALQKRSKASLIPKEWT